MDLPENALARIERRFDELSAHITAQIANHHNEMLVLHEDVVGRIKALADPDPSIDRRIAAGDAAVREELTARVDPLELVVREHSADIDRLKNRRRH